MAALDGSEGGWVGRPLARVEDRRLLEGVARFVADRAAPGALHMAVLRSPHASARLVRVDTSALKAMDGVADALTFDDLRELPGPIPLYRPHPALRARTPYPLAADRVRYVGEPVVSVLASTPERAADALEAIVVEYDPEPAVTDGLDALAPGAPLVHADLGSNVAAEVEGRTGDPDAAFATADRVVRVALRIGRQSPQPIEPRGVVAAWSAEEQTLTVWDATQSPHMVRRVLAYLLRLRETQIRVVAGDLGGGFGGKGRFYPEEFLAAFLSMRQRRPVRWIATRHEELLAMYQEREQIQHGELALRSDGTILGLRVSYVDVAGAYTPFGIVTSNMAAMRAVGPYRIRDYEYRYRVVYAHKAGLAPYRGAGQPQGVYLIERLVDRAARELGVDPAELRLRNMITAAEQPWDTGLRRDDRPLVYDGGDYPRAFRRALDLVGHAEFAREQATLRTGGRYIGLGVVPGIEVGSIGPPEAARVAIDRDGHVTVWAGGASIGQGLETVLTQVCADALGVRPERITVLLGDTAQLTSGGGSFASRGAVAAGNAVATAAARVRERALTIAAHLLEAAPADLEITDGRVEVRGVPEGAIALGTLVEVVSQPILGAGRPWPATRPLPWDDTLGLEASAVHRPDFTFSYAVHAAVVEVDVATGAVDVLRYVVVHDCGKVLNPAIVDGQITGGVAQGLGGALFEEIIHDGAGQNLSSTLMSYVLPRASQVPAFTLDRLETPAANPLGVKGAGEGGVMPVAAAISAAVDDALAPWGTFCARTPLTPERVWTMIQAAARLTAGPSAP